MGWGGGGQGHGVMKEDLDAIIMRAEAGSTNACVATAGCWQRKGGLLLQ